MGNIREAIKIILAVLGIVSAYPNVDYDNVFVYRNFEKNVVYLQFKAYNMITPPIRDIIESGIDVNLIYQIKTVFNNRVLYKGDSIRRISFYSNFYFIDGKGKYNFGVFTNAISVNEMVILTDASQFTNKLLQTDVDLLINCDATPEIINLWGKRPQITYKYIVEE